MPDLVSLTDLKTFLGVDDSDDDTLLTDLLEHVEALFESQAGRTASPFQAATNNVTEVHDGTGCEVLFLEYPISSVDSLKVGFDSSDPIETLDPTDIDVLSYGTGKRRVVRTDGGIFGPAGKPRYIHVQYDTQADLPEHAQLAIKRVVAQVFQQIDSEGAKSERVGGYSREMADLVATDSLWKQAVASCQHWVMA